MTFHQQILGKPGQHEIPSVVGAKQADQSSPGVPLPQNVGEAGAVVTCAHRRHRPDLGRDDEPRNYPQQTREPDEQKHGAPAVSIKNESAYDHARGRTKFATDVDQPVRQSTLAFLKVGGDYLGIGWVRYRLANT